MYTFHTVADEEELQLGCKKYEFDKNGNHNKYASPEGYTSGCDCDGAWFPDQFAFFR